MKNKYIHLVFTLVLLVFLAYSTIINPIKTESVKVIVIDKFDKDHLHKYKSTITINGIETWMRIYSKKYGYADIQTTTNTYMTTRVGEEISFNWSEYKIANIFNANQPSIFRNPIILTLIIALIWCIVFLIINMSKF